MSLSYESQIEYTLPDLSGVFSSLNSLRAENAQLTGELERSTAHQQQLAGEIHSLGGSVSECRRDNQRLAGSLAHTQRAVADLSGEQHRLSLNQSRLEAGLGQVNEGLGRINQAQQRLGTTLSTVQAEQQQHQDRLRRINSDLLALDTGQQRLRDDLDRQRQQTEEELACLRDYQKVITERQDECARCLHELNEVSACLQKQQTQTLQLVRQVSHDTQKVHQELQTFERIVEDRHHTAQEALKRQALSVSGAQQLAREDLQLLDRHQALRFDLQPDIEAVEQRLRLADSQAADPALLNSALGLYCEAATQATRLRQQLRQLVQDQARREVEIRHRLDQVQAVVRTWQADEVIAHYHADTLQRWRQRSAELLADLESLAHSAGSRTLGERTAALRLRAEDLAGEAGRHNDQVFPNLMEQHQQRLRFIDAIEKGIRDTFRRLEQEVEVDYQLADPGKTTSPLHLCARTPGGTRTVIAEVGLDGNCHFWWEGYTEKNHVRDAAELEKLLRRGKELAYNVTGPRTFKDEPSYPPSPPPPWIVKRPTNRPSNLDLDTTTDQPDSRPKPRESEHEGNS